MIKITLTSILQGRERSDDPRHPLTHYASETASNVRSQLVALSYCEGDSGELEQARMGWKYPSTWECLALVLC